MKTGKSVSFRVGEGQRDYEEYDGVHGCVMNGVWYTVFDRVGWPDEGLFKGYDVNPEFSDPDPIVDYLKDYLMDYFDAWPGITKVVTDAGIEWVRRSPTACTEDEN
jgi:hypothetical protein